MKPPNNDVIPQGYKMTDNTAVGVENFVPRQAAKWVLVA